MFTNILRAQPKLKLALPQLAKPSLSRHYIPHNSVIPIPPKPDSDFPSWLNPSKYTLYIRGIDPAVTREDLQGVFSRYGALKRVVIPKTKEDGTKREFAYVEYYRLDDAVNAYEWCNFEKVWLYKNVVDVRWDNMKRDRHYNVWRKVKRLEKASCELRKLPKGKSATTPTP